MRLATACNGKVATKITHSGDVLPVRAYFPYAQFSAVGWEKEEVTPMRRIILLMTVAALVVVSTPFVVSSTPSLPSGLVMSRHYFSIVSKLLRPPSSCALC
jgi:hypothetical protein